MSEQTYFERRSAVPGGLPTSIDLFSGAGGLAEGFRQVGFAIVSGVDQDAPAGETFRHNFPEASFFQRPIAEVSGAELLADAGLAAGDLDCLIGGPPCQAFSYNNHQRTDQGHQARLFEHYLRIVEELEPKSLVMENVPGILTVGGGSIVEEIFRSLEALGYEVDAKILYAEEYGVPQERRRVFFVATRLGWEDGLFPDGVFGPVAKPAEKQRDYVHRWQRRPGVQYGTLNSLKVWAAIGDLPSLANGGGKDEAEYTRPATTILQRLLRGEQRILHNHVAPALTEKMLKRIAHVKPGGSWRDIPFDLLPAGMKRAKRSCHTKRYGRPNKRDLSSTILTKPDPHWGAYVHPVDNRAFSVREMARLQSFPDYFQFVGPKSEQFAQVGNAVPPLLAAALGRSVLAHLERNGIAPEIDRAA